MATIIGYNRTESYSVREVLDVVVDRLNSSSSDAWVAFKGMDGLKVAVRPGEVTKVYEWTPEES